MIKWWSNIVSSAYFYSFIGC